MVKISNTWIQGFVSQEGVANYLGLKYASIPARFRTATLLEVDRLGDFVDASAYGPCCPQPENKNQESRRHLFAGTVSWPPVSMSEFECLNLNIYTPSESLLDPSGCPVVVWIHGGGWIFGAGGPEYDGNYLIKHSVNKGKPCVLVTINYRLGRYGFLASGELQAEAESNAENYYPNQGLHDQQLALQWVQRYVHHFGGNPSKVTIAGQSAGGFSALTHLITDIPLCRAGWIMSSPLDPFISVTQAQQTFDRLVTGTGLRLSSSNSEKLTKLRNLTELEMDELVRGKMLIRPVWDPIWFAYQEEQKPVEWTSDFPEWLQGLTIGWAADEVITFQTLWASWSVQELLATVNVMIPDQEMERDVIQIYGIAGPPEKALSGFVEFASDCLYTRMPQALSQAQFPISIYRFEQIDDFNGSVYRGSAYHCLDNAYLFRLPAIAGTDAPEARRLTTDAVSDRFLAFVYGTQAWEPFKTGQKIMYFNGANSGLVESKAFEKLSQLVSTEERETILIDAAERMLEHMR
ncbi:Alpha/Beta hydrolase protein, partial [Exophiala viscosa]|uniref:Alpha/Beta hydrolase protein n=1 Tax=Exophiala viscosa TaxID=2486360 RepID=UPI00219EF173